MHPGSDPDVDQLVLLALDLAEVRDSGQDLEEVAALVHRASDSALEDDWDEVASLTDRLPEGMAEGIFPTGLAPLDAALFLFAHGARCSATGRAPEAVETFRRMIALEEAGGEPREGLARSWGRLATAFALCGRDAEAMGAFERSQALFDGAGEWYEPLQYALELGDALAGAGRPEPAAAVYRRTLEVARKAGAPAEHVRAIEERL